MPDIDLGTCITDEVLPDIICRFMLSINFTVKKLILSVCKIIIFLQIDNKGRNFLHNAILRSDIEGVLFLLSVHCNINSRVQDASQLTPLHLAVNVGAEIIVRNLVSTLIT